MGRVHGRTGGVQACRRAGWLALLACVAGLVPAAHPGAWQARADAAAADPVIVHYRAYEAALQAGDLARARQEAVAAWSLAQAAWPDSNPGKGALAYNAAWIQIVTGSAAEARDASGAAVRLWRAGSPYLEQEAGLMARRAALAQPGAQTRPQEVEAVAALAADLEQRDRVDPVVGLILADLSQMQSRNLRSDRGQALAARSIAALGKAGEVPGPVAARAFIARAQAVLGRGNSPRLVVAAYRDLARATLLYGDPGVTPAEDYYSLTALRLTLLGVARSLRVSPRDLEGDIWLGRGDPGIIGQPDCPQSVAIARRTTLDHGQLGDVPGILGGVILLVDIRRDGSVAAARVAASLPSRRLGEQTREDLLRWQFAVPPGYPERCLAAYPVHVSYSFRPAR